MMANEAGAPVVLVIEDHEANLMLTRAVLRRAGYRVDEARSAEEALQHLSAARPDAILMDVHLPGQDGLALTRHIKADPATSAIPVIALTADAMSGDAERCLEAGCAGYISKPIDTRSFAATLAGILEGQAQRV
jgi:CheY-like chemotaxis protein